MDILKAQILDLSEKLIKSNKDWVICTRDTRDILKEVEAGESLNNLKYSKNNLQSGDYIILLKTDKIKVEKYEIKIERKSPFKEFMDVFVTKEGLCILQNN